MSRMGSNVSAREGGEATSKIETQMANGAESLEDLTKCESKKDDNSTSIIPSEAIIEWKSDETETTEPIFPSEVVIEILCWLPLRSLAKLQLVCKEWRGFILGRYLVEKKMNRSEVCHWLNATVPRDPTKPDGNGESFMLLDGCDGLLLIRSFPTMKLTIWNPATCGVLDLPDPHKNAFGAIFSYVKSTGKYLVVSLYNDESGRESCEVLTPGQSESWRPLAFPDVAETEGRGEKQCAQVVAAGGAVHTVLILKVGSTVTKKVVSLDLETECFTVTCFTKTKVKNLRTFWAMDWNGKLALTTIVGNNLHVTELEDYKKQRWSQQNKVIPLSFLQEGSDDDNQDVISLVPLLTKDGVIWFNFENDAIVSYTIETGCTKATDSIGLLPAGKLCPYKPTLVGFHGMQQDAKFGRRRSSPLKLD